MKGAGQGKKSKSLPPGRRLPRYVLVTPARNEAAYIELTLKSMVEQTCLPVAWVIVSDGSTDGTDEIVQRYAAGRPWIELLRMPERTERHFAGKVHAFNAGYRKVRDREFDIIGNLDGDISFAPDHFEYLLGKFEENPRLGVAGTAFIENSAVAYNYRYTQVEHVSGQCQLFRRACFDAVGGYKPRKMGGIDLVAVMTARMMGWQTRTFPERTFVHHRQMGTGMYSSAKFVFKGGQVDYILGSHPAWQILRCLYQMKNRPRVIGGPLRLTGYFWAMAKGAAKDVPPELVAFRRKEQMTRLRDFFRKILS